MSCVPHYVFISNLLKQQVSPLILMHFISFTFLSICVWAQESTSLYLKNIHILLITAPDNQKIFHHSISRRRKSNIIALCTWGKSDRGLFSDHLL